MADTIVLEANKRDLVGKQVKHLRAQGVIPGVLYGPAFDSVPLQIEWLKLRPVLREAGGSQLIQLTVNDEAYNALVRDVQRDPIRGEVLHIDFYRVRMDVAIRADVPIILIGDETAIASAEGVLTHELTSVTVECLPTDLPAQIQVDISVLQEIGDSILAKNLPDLSGVSYLVSEEDVVVSTMYLERPEEEEEEEIVEEDIYEEGDEPELIRRRDDEDIEDED